MVKSTAFWVPVPGRFRGQFTVELEPWIVPPEAFTSSGMPRSTNAPPEGPVCEPLMPVMTLRRLYSP